MYIMVNVERFIIILLQGYEFMDSCRMIVTTSYV